MNIVTIILLAIAATFLLLSSLGLHRFKTVYTRIHAATLSTTFGSIFVVAAIVYHSITTFEQGIEGIINSTFILHSLIALVALLLTNPVSSHAIAKAAQKAGYKVEVKTDNLGKGDKSE